MDIWTVLSIEEDSNNHACHTTDPSSSCKDGPIIGNNVKDRVYKWRAQAEDAMRSQGKPAMTPAEVQDFVARFMPAYFTYLPWLYQFGPERRLGSGVGKVDNIPVVKVIVDELRSASSVYELE